VQFSSSLTCEFERPSAADSLPPHRTPHFHHLVLRRLCRAQPERALRHESSPLAMHRAQGFVLVFRPQAAPYPQPMVARAQVLLTCNQEVAHTSTDRIEKQITVRAPLSRVWKGHRDAQEFGALVRAFSSKATSWPERRFADLQRRFRRAALVEHQRSLGIKPPRSSCRPEQRLLHGGPRQPEPTQLPLDPLRHRRRRPPEGDRRRSSSFVSKQSLKARRSTSSNPDSIACRRIGPTAPSA